MSVRTSMLVVFMLIGVILGMVFFVIQLAKVLVAG